MKRALVLVEGQTEEAFVKDVLQEHFGASLSIAATMLVTRHVSAGGSFRGSDRPNGTPLVRVTHVETAIHAHFGTLSNFVPYLSLHEFEALLFSAPDVLPRILIGPHRAEDFAAIRASVATPEEINERPESAPSKRILSLFPGYRKTLYGPSVCKEIGIQQLRAECPHFDGWIQRLEAFAHSP